MDIEERLTRIEDVFVAAATKMATGAALEEMFRRVDASQEAVQRLNDSPGRSSRSGTDIQALVDPACQIRVTSARWLKMRLTF